MNNNDKIVIKKRGDDGNRVITIRIKEDLLRETDNIATECNYSRNELICLLLKHGFLQLFFFFQRDASFRLRPDKDIGFILYAF